MRDFRHAKAMAKTLRAALAAKGLKLSISESLELIAGAYGAAVWNTLAAAIRAAQSEKSAEQPATRPPPEPTPAADAPSRGTSFTAALAATLRQSVGLASSRRHSYNTLEHLLLALTEDADAVAVLEGCKVDVADLRTALTRYIDDELLSLVAEEGESTPTASFHRVVRRAVIHVQASGRGSVTGANILVAIFSERESHACLFLTEQGMTRYDAVNFMVHGIRKSDAAA
jgi:hypothetical protein